VIVNLTRTNLFQRTAVLATITSACNYDWISFNNREGHVIMHIHLLNTFDNTEICIWLCLVIYVHSQHNSRGCGSFTSRWILHVIDTGLTLGYWHQRADERHGNPPPNQELLLVRDKVGRPPGEFGVCKSMECDIFPSVLWRCWLGDRKGIQPVKKLDVGLLVVMIWLELCTTYSSSCHHHFHHPLLQ